MKHLTTLLLTLLVLGGCANYELMKPLEASKDFRATASAPELEELIDEGLCLAGCKPNLIFSCDTMPSVEDAKSCAINKCNEHYQYIKESRYWKNKDKEPICIAYDTSSYSPKQEWDLKFGIRNYYDESALCKGRYDNAPNCMRKILDDYKNLYADARLKNKSLYIGPKKQAELDRAKAIYEANVRANRELERRAKERQRSLERTQRLQAEAQERKLQSQREEFLAYIEMLKENCESFGFTEDNAIATCVQREINLERDRIQARQIAQQNQLIIQQAQPSNRSSQPNLNALRSMGNCLQTEGSFVACSNAWEGYSPPKKIVTKCRYDALGNAIIGTCTTP